MNRSANFYVMGERTDCDALVLIDVGPWNIHPSVTNDAENVVRRLLESGDLKPGQRLMYYDSEGNLDEILIADGQFAGFAPGPR